MNTRNTLLLLILIQMNFACMRNGSTGISFDVKSTSEQIDNTTTKLLPSEYAQWVQNMENGLKQEKTIEELDFSIQYKPYNYIICQEKRSDSIRTIDLDENVKELEGMEYYDFRIKVNNQDGELLKHKLSSSDEYKKRVEYYSFKMDKDISLVDGLDTIPCSLFHFERGFNAAPYSTFLLGFVTKRETDIEGDKTFIYEDKIFNKGIIKFSFSKNKLVNIPKLKTI
jgi:hypothetical protein